jgi:hypothetical protein
MAVDPFIISGHGILLAATGVFLSTGIAIATMSGAWPARVLAASLVMGAFIVLVDAFGASNRLTISNPEFSIIAPLALTIAYSYYMVRQFYRFQLRTKLIVSLFLVTVVAVGALSVVSQLTTQQALIDRMTTNLSNVARTQALHIGELLQRQVSALNTLSLTRFLQEDVVAANLAYTGDAAAIQRQIDELDEQWRAADAAGSDSDPLVRARLTNDLAHELQEYRKAYPDHVEVFITDRYGALVAATNRTSDYYQADEDWWQAAYNGGQGGVYIGEPDFDESAGTLSVNMAVPVRLSVTGVVVGVLRTTYRLSALEALITAAASEESATTGLLFPQSNRIFAPGVRGLEDASADDLAAIQASANTPFIETNYEGAVSLLSTATVRTLDNDPTIAGLKWTALVHQDRVVALMPVEFQKRAILLTALVIVGLVSISALGLAVQVP